MAEPLATEQPGPNAATDDPPSAATSPGGGRSSINKTVRDLTLSMGLIAVVIFVALVISRQPQPDPVRVVDAVPVARAAATVADFRVLFPAVPPGWRATSARWEPTAESGEQPVWFNGWVTDHDQYAAVIQSKAASPAFVKEQTDGAYPAKDADVGIATPGWTAYWSTDGATRSLVRQRDGVTTIVTSTQDWPQLVAFRDLLRPVEQASGP